MRRSSSKHYYDDSMKKAFRQDILHGPVTENLILLMYPILICGLFQQLYQMADAVVVGRFAQGNAIAIVGGSASMLISLFTGLASGIVTGSMFVTAFFSGQNSKSKIQNSAQMSILIAAVTGVLCTILFILFSEQILNILHVPSDILNDSAVYLRIYALGFAPYFIFQVSVNLLRALGEAKRPTRYLILSFLLNIILDFLFTGLFRLQQNGVAIAFIISQSCSAALALYDINTHTHLHLFSMHMDLDTVKRILSIGIPSSVTSIIYALTNILIQSSFNLLGSDMVAGYAIHSKIESLYWIIFTGLGMAVTTFAGQNYGAGNKQRLKETVRRGIRLGYLIAIPIALMFYFMSVPLSSIFTKDPKLIGLGSTILKYMAPFYLCYPVIEIITQILKCIGKAVQSTVITLLCISVVRVIWILTVAMKNLCYQNILLAFPISWTIASAVFLIYYSIERKKLLNETYTCDAGTVSR